MRLMAVAGQDTKRYPDSGGRGFGRLIAGKPVDAAPHQTCFACHEGRVKGHDLVFTRWEALRRTESFQITPVSADDGGLDPPPTCAD